MSFETEEVEDIEASTTKMTKRADNLNAEIANKENSDEQEDYPVKRRRGRSESSRGKVAKLSFLTFRCVFRTRHSKASGKS